LPRYPSFYDCLLGEGAQKWLHQLAGQGERQVAPRRAAGELGPPFIEFGSNKEVQFSNTNLAEVVIEGGEKGLGES